jgi:hypothetical protein
VTRGKMQICIKQGVLLRRRALGSNRKVDSLFVGIARKSTDYGCSKQVLCPLKGWELGDGCQSGTWWLYKKEKGDRILLQLFSEKEK